VTKPLKYVGKRLKSAYKWIPFVPTVTWAEKNVYLNPDTSPITGLINFKYSPHLVEVFNDFDKTHVWKQILNFSTQSGKTLAQQIAMAKALDTDPCRMQWAIPVGSKLGEYIEEKIEPFLRGVKSVKKKMEDYISKEKLRDKRTLIRIPGGGCAFTGTSASEKRSRSVRYIFMDEVALFEAGSFVELEGRTKASEKFFRKVMAVSSRKQDGDELDIAYASCETIKEWHTVCKKCNHNWLAGSNDLKWITPKEYREKFNVPDGEIDISKYKQEALKDVYLECPNCSHHIKSHEKDQQILDGKYRFVIIQGNENGKTIGYRANALAMFLTTFETIASMAIEDSMKGNIEGLTQIYIDYFNEFYEREMDTTSKNDILLLSNGLRGRIVPKDHYRVYMGIDTQKDHFWYTVVVYCYGNKSHTLMYGRAENTGDLEVIMGLQFDGEDGKKHGIDRVGIDRMGIKERTIEVDAWVEYLIVHEGLQDFIYPTMGVSKDSTMRPFVEVEIDKDLTTGERRKTPLKALKLNNLLLKNELHNSITRNIKKSKGEEEYQDIDTRLFFINQDMVDFAEAQETSLSTDFERQMTSEIFEHKVDKKTGKVAKEPTWEKKHENIDNHYWDCYVICTALALKDHINSVQKPKDASVSDLMKGILS